MPRPDQRVLQPALVGARGGDVGNLDGLRRDGQPACRPLALAHRRLARDLQIFLGEALGGAQVELLGRLVVLVDGSAGGAAELHGPGHDGREHGRELQRRADRLPDLAQRRELADRARQRRRPLLQLLEEPGVLDGDHRLVGERLEQADLAVAEGTRLRAPARDGPDHLAIAQHRDGQERAVSSRSLSGVAQAIGRQREHVRDVDHPALEDGLPDRHLRPGRYGKNAFPGAEHPRAPGSLDRSDVEHLAVEAQQRSRHRLRRAVPRSPTMASNTGWTSVGDRAITRRISPVAVCCSSASVSSALRASNSLNSRTFSMAMTA